MSGSVWMFSDQIDDEDMDFIRHEFVTYSMASDYYGLGLKPVSQLGENTKNIVSFLKIIAFCIRAINGVKKYE